MPQPASTPHRFTYSEYCRWSDDERWELIDGEAYDISPAPTRLHQELVLEIARQVANHLQGKACDLSPSSIAIRS